MTQKQKRPPFSKEQFCCNFNKLAHLPLPQQLVSTSSLVQDFDKRKWFTKELPRTQKCLMGKNIHTTQGKACSVYNLGYICFSRGKGSSQKKGRNFKNRHCCKIPILADSLWPCGTVKPLISLEPCNSLNRTRIMLILQTKKLRLRKAKFTDMFTQLISTGLRYEPHLNPKSMLLSLDHTYLKNKIQAQRC